MNARRGADRLDALVVLTTFAVTLLVGPERGILAGVPPSENTSDLADFTSEKVTPTVSREKDGKSGLLYAQIGRFQNRPASRGACAAVPRRYV